VASFFCHCFAGTKRSRLERIVGPRPRLIKVLASVGAVLATNTGTGQATLWEQPCVNSASVAGQVTWYPVGYAAAVATAMEVHVAPVPRVGICQARFRKRQDGFCGEIGPEHSGLMTERAITVCHFRRVVTDFNLDFAAMTSCDLLHGSYPR
jgi:hypothetical protein